MADRRAQERSYDNKEPDVLIVGGGYAGLTSAVELKQLGLDALVVDAMKRVGDNWRLRYHSLKLHNVTSVNHLPYMPFENFSLALHPEGQDRELA